jgi:hypothetical protein
MCSCAGCLVLSVAEFREVEQLRGEAKRIVIMLMRALPSEGLNAGLLE